MYKFTSSSIPFKNNKNAITILMFIFFFTIPTINSLTITQPHPSSVPPPAPTDKVYPESFSRSGCHMMGQVEFYPRMNTDNLFGYISFIETSGGKEVVVNAILATEIGLDGLKDPEDPSKPLYNMELIDDENKLVYDLTAPIFNNALYVVSLKIQRAPLSICDKTKSIIGKYLVIKKDGVEIDRAKIFGMLDTTNGFIFEQF
ncbi:18718_t:CDS:1 [Entrophospora sp. SA101]|nr:12999_t:CDS:1 [Entrophospora sp. SA101]CAJ0644444.1 15928_t:CDS:1 [Entrophospora sp. SA101]CAJ0745448.1 203_t:CDS:1 [Entrophospora sp. SA101]CAJ0749601.1 18718_t:CDS:1 [Entrophospora sp. SA101]CAJ0831449.1 12534_t:CDS:1 [Entrophospora sp. SA101]